MQRHGERRPDLLQRSLQQIPEQPLVVLALTRPVGGRAVGFRVDGKWK